MQEFWKSVKIWQSYCHRCDAPFLRHSVDLILTEDVGKYDCKTKIMSAAAVRPPKKISAPEVFLTILGFHTHYSGSTVKLIDSPAVLPRYTAITVTVSLFTVNVSVYRNRDR